MEYVIEMNNITKVFPGIVANDDITLQVKQGEIHALLGENGAGKSTLMNVLFGLYQPEQGEIKIKGNPVKITNPNIANDLGIGMVHQHFMLVHNFTVTENIILGNEPKKNGKIAVEEAAKEIKQLSEQYGLAVDPHAKIEDISVGMQQRVEILKTLYRGAEILIFDEPTAVLTPQEIHELIQIMKKLVQEGKSIILITHKLKEIMEVCDRCTIIRKGKGIGHIPEDRHKHGLVLDFSVRDNIVLQTYYKNPFSKKGILNFSKITQKAKALIEQFDVRTPSEQTLARALSGGNQQKAIIAREVDRNPDLLIAAQPTRGLDVGAIEFIHKKLIEQRDNGKAVLLLSLELDEILNVSDRVAVIYEGKIVAIVDAKETNEQQLGLLMAGGTGKEKVNTNG